MTRISNFKEWVKDKKIAKEEFGKHHFVFLEDGKIYLKINLSTLDWAYEIPKQNYERIKSL